MLCWPDNGQYSHLESPESVFHPYKTWFALVKKYIYNMLNTK
jgi:hypothetical protein